MLTLLVAMEGRFLRAADGVYSTHLTYSRLWSRYTEIFDTVAVLARVSAVDVIPHGWERADGPRVEFHDLPDYHGVREYLSRHGDIVRTVRRAVRQCDGAILRVPGLVSTLAWQELRRMGRKYAVEVVGDPFEALMYTDLPLPVRVIAARIGAWNLRRQCRGAVGAAYVTERVLQSRYPSGAFQASFSDVELPKDVFVGQDVIHKRRSEWEGIAKSKSRAWRISFVGSLAQPYKGLGVLLDALLACSRRGLDWRLRVVGDGRLKEFYRKAASDLGISDRVEFLGRLPAGGPVMEQLDWADLFILPSLTEGMPRALLEAMARGLPCIASSVGGIPELLPREALVPGGRPDLLADAICQVLASPQLMEQLALSNLSKAKEFESDLLADKRGQFYASVKERMSRASAEGGASRGATGEVTVQL